MDGKIRNFCTNFILKYSLIWSLMLYSLSKSLFLPMMAIEY